MPHNQKAADEAFRLAKSSEDGTISPEGGSMKPGVSPPNDEVLTERVLWNRPKSRRERGQG